MCRFGYNVEMLLGTPSTVSGTGSILDAFLSKVQTFDPYPVLYARTSTGAVQTWKVEVSGNKYRFRTGQKGSPNLVTSDWTVCQGKNIGRSNETTGEAQASKEASAAFRKKLKSDGYWESEADIDKVRFVEPILAKLYKDYASDIDFSMEEWGCQNKYNGICCLINKGGAYSRRGEKFIQIPHIVDTLADFFTKHPNAVLHGELFNDEYRQRLNEIAKLCRKTVHLTPKDFEDSERLIRYYIYDGYFPDDNLGEDSPYKNRKRFIDTQVIGVYAYCELVETILIRSTSELDCIFATHIKRGDEGIMLRKMDMPYEHKRSRNLLKVKPEDDAEATIIRVIEGRGNWSGTAKTATIQWEGKAFDATFVGSHGELSNVLKNKEKWEGKKVTFLYIGLTGLGTPNSARIDVNNCFKGDR